MSHIKFTNKSDLDDFLSELARHHKYWGEIVDVDEIEGAYYVPLNEWTEPISEGEEIVEI
jgi:hypothetical protein